jgi:hypothetical protein
MGKFDEIEKKSEKNFQNLGKLSNLKAKNIKL